MDFILAILGSLLSLVVIFLYLLRSAVENRSKAAQSILSTQFVAQAFSHRFGEQCPISSVAIPSIAKCGDGKASTSDRITLHTHWHDTMQQERLGCPTEMILKFSLLPWYLRLGAAPGVIQLTGKFADFLSHFRLDFVIFNLVNVYQWAFPHAPDAMYENETRFYRDIRPHLDPAIEAPAVFGTIYDQRSCTYGIFMENLLRKRAQFPTAREELTLAQLHHVLYSLSALHATFWESPRFESSGDLAWVPTTQRGGMELVFHSIGFGLIRDHVRTHAFERRLLAPLGLTIEQLWQGLLRAEAILNEAPVTLCHGDTHVQNTYVLPNSRVGLFDWQLMLRASWARDVSYILGTALPPAMRCEHEHALLTHYLISLNDQLRQRHSPHPAPPFDQALLRYSQAMAWGLVIGWLICPPANYGEAIWSANVSRLVAACVHLNTFAHLGITRSST